MKKLILTTSFLLSILSVQAQEFFSDKRPVQSANQFTKKVNDISYDIDLIIKNNKEKLKQDLNEIDQKVESNQLTKVEADKLRNEKAEFYAKRIEEETKVQEDKIKVLINNKIEDNINFSTDMSAYQKNLIEKKIKASVYLSIGSSFMMVDNKFKNSYYDSSIVPTFGAGLSFKTRLGSEISSFFWKADIGMLSHSINIRDNKTIESINSETVLTEIPFKVDRTNLYFADFRLSNYLEYDFSKKKDDEFGNMIIKSRRSFYVGMGGFIGISPTMSKNMRYHEGGEKYRSTNTSEYNINKFIYGIGGYFGYKSWNITVNYNLNNTFKKSFADQSVLNVSLVYNSF